MNWRIKKFNELELNELYAILQLRSEIFVVEQDCVYQDIDGLDKKAFHIMAYDEEKLVAYARIFEAGIYFEEASIGRVVVKESYRKRKIGYELMNASIAFIQQTLGCYKIRISAQQYLIDFYENLGFKSFGDGYLEDGIPHIAMLLKKV